MKTKRIAKLGAATVASGFLTAGVLGATTVAAHADQSIDVTKDYTCAVTAAGANLGNYTIGVRTQVTLPDTYTPGATIPGRNVNITLNLPENLRASTSAIGGRSADGGSANTVINLVNSGQTSSVPIQNLSAPRTDIPQTVNQVWTVPATGQVPGIPVPAQASGNTDVLLPTGFFINSTIYTTTTAQGGGNQIPGTLDCTIATNTTANRKIATITDSTQVGAAPVAADVSTSTDYATPVGVTLSATDSDSTPAQLTYTAAEPAHGTLSGTGTSRTYTPDADFAGTDTFSYTVTDQNGNSDTATVSVDVAKADSTTKAKGPRSAKAGKPVDIKVTVTSDATADGPVTVSLKGKKVGSGTVSDGKATVTISAKKTKGLKGKTTFTVDYAGNDVVDGSSAKAKVTFKK